ncbi:MAG: 1-(5-phosphoribosyl)-5-[(5-phosphoribosylamino)methylideneamino]imidazole-4-carboxamide isomerase [Chthoniobacterales bacterium]
MKLLPAIDLMRGEVVRLKQGDPKQKTVYSKDPVAFAQRWAAEGGDWLHLVDLDAAFSGQSSNLDCVRKIVEAVSIPCELGGGIRDMAAAARVLQVGVKRIIIGTRAAESTGFVREAVKEFGSAAIAVGIDARDGKVSTHGWQQDSKLDALDFAKEIESCGAGTVIYTDISTDGMLKGPNFAAMELLVSKISCQVIASGGVSSADDLRRLNKIDGLYGAIIGKALYDGLISGNLRELLNS